MPAVSRFLGIIIYMYAEPDGPHHAPHFHARYAGYRASFSIDPSVLLAGSLPRRQLRFVLAWAELHQDEIVDNWQRLEQGEPPRQIEGI